MPQRAEELADRLRQLSPAIAVEVTECSWNEDLRGVQALLAERGV
jgi:hypothetical protein